MLIIAACVFLLILFVLFSLFASRSFKNLVENFFGIFGSIFATIQQQIATAINSCRAAANSIYESLGETRFIRLQRVFGWLLLLALFIGLGISSTALVLMTLSPMLGIKNVEFPFAAHIPLGAIVVASAAIGGLIFSDLVGLTRVLPLDASNKKSRIALFAFLIVFAIFLVLAAFYMALSRSFSLDIADVALSGRKLQLSDFAGYSFARKQTIIYVSFLDIFATFFAGLGFVYGWQIAWMMILYLFTAPLVILNLFFLMPLVLIVNGIQRVCNSLIDTIVEVQNNLGQGRNAEGRVPGNQRVDLNTQEVRELGEEAIESRLPPANGDGESDENISSISEESIDPLGLRKNNNRR
jgi:uncharacterized integral membrane protein